MGAGERLASPKSMSSCFPCRPRGQAVHSGALAGTGEAVMDGLEALLKEIKRVLSSAPAEPLLVWPLAALSLALALALAFFLLRRPPGPRNDVEQLFLASAAATRRAREISEIDVFARKASATAEDLKARIRKLRSGHFQQLKIYIDHSNFIRTWTQVVHGRDRPLEHDVNWAELPQVLAEECSDWLSRNRKGQPALVYRGTNVYGTLFQEDYFKLLET